MCSARKRAGESGQARAINPSLGHVVRSNHGDAAVEPEDDRPAVQGFSAGVRRVVRPVTAAVLMGVPILGVLVAIGVVPIRDLLSVLILVLGLFLTLIAYEVFADRRESAEWVRKEAASDAASPGVLTTMALATLAVAAGCFYIALSRLIE